jgi:hypothetical protein
MNSNRGQYYAQIIRAGKLEARPGFFLNFKGIPLQKEHKTIFSGLKITKIALSGNSDATHCKPGEAYTRLITATCEAGPGTTHMCTFEICVWSLHILEIADRCVFHNSIFGSSKCHLYIDFMKNLKSSCQDSNHHPFNDLW